MPPAVPASRRAPLPRVRGGRSAICLEKSWTESVRRRHVISAFNVSTLCFYIPPLQFMGGAWRRSRP